MRVLASILVLVFASLFTTASLAQAALTECPNVDLTGPTDGAVLDPGYRVNFTWDSEPRGTASREWISVKVDLDDGSFTFENAKRESAEPGIHKGFARGTPGVYAWAVVFYDADGNPICQSEARTYFVTGTGFPDAPANFQPGSVAVVKASLGRYVVKFFGSDYAGAFNRELAKGDNDYIDADDAKGQYDWQALGYEGLDVHGNNKDNKIVGSNKNDRLYGYGGNDKIRGLGGNDHIEGGNESCKGLICFAGDDLDGGDGNDTIIGGNETCTALKCIVGDRIVGGSGNDHIEGGNEACVGLFCSAGDNINAGSGTDTIDGGQESCIGLACNAADVIDGGPDLDGVFPAGVNTCVGLACNTNDQVTGVP